jgi:hypothetical protein
MKSRTEHSVEEFLSAFPAGIRHISDRLRALINQSVPGLIESVYPGWQLIGYRVIKGKKSHYFCFIAPKPDRVVLGFEYGRLMEDPAGLLQGSGKQVLQVAFEKPEDIDESRLRPLILECALIAQSRHASR